MRNTALRKMASDAGLALIAVQGINGTWDLPYGPRTFNSTGAAEFAYFDAVIDDAVSRFAIDPNRIVASGFSAGGMMVWNLICARANRFAGFIPFSGTFWLKPPVQCAPPISNVIHIHGDQDRTVPLNGRAIADTKQGIVSEALAFYGDLGAFKAVSDTTHRNLSCENRRNATGNILVFCLFPGGHSFSVQHLRYALDLLQAAGHL